MTTNLTTIYGSQAAGWPRTMKGIASYRRGRAESVKTFDFGIDKIIRLLLAFVLIALFAFAW